MVCINLKTLPKGLLKFRIIYNWMPKPFSLLTISSHFNFASFCFMLSQACHARLLKFIVVILNEG